MCVKVNHFYLDDRCLIINIKSLILTPFELSKKCYECNKEPFLRWNKNNNLKNNDK